MDLSVMIANQNVNEILYHSQRIDSPTFKETNQAIADLVANMTSGLRERKQTL